LIKSVIKDWGSDSIVFFNYNRINAALDNQDMKKVIDALFGAERAERLRMETKELEPEDREQMIMYEFRSALNEVKGEYCLTYRFELSDRNRTSHYLVFVTKHERGYAIMKRIMAPESKLDEEGIPLFEHPSTLPKQYSLFTRRYTIDRLAEMLLNHFAGQTLSMKEIFHHHNVGTPYIEKNYKKVLLRLEKQGKIHATPPIKERRKNTFGDDVQVRFFKESI
jgi:hypothetical protein